MSTIANLFLASSGRHALGAGVRSLAAASVLAACVPEFEADPSLVTEPRVLAVRSEPAEAPENTPLRLLALQVNPTGSPDARLRWAFCASPKPLSELGPVDQACVDAFAVGRAANLVEVGRGAVVDAHVPVDACRTFGPIPNDEASGEGEIRPVDADSTGGFYQPVLVDQGAPVLGRVRLDCGLTGLSPAEQLAYRQAYRPNQNPEIEALTASLDGEPISGAADEPWRVPAGATLTLRASWPRCPERAACGDAICSAGEDRVSCPDDCEVPQGCGGAEPFALFDRATRQLVTRRERLSLVWYSDVGGFAQHESDILAEDAQSVSNEWLAPSSAREVHIWLVLRDERGGVAFKTFTLDVTAR